MSDDSSSVTSEHSLAPGDTTLRLSEVWLRKAGSEDRLWEYMTERFQNIALLSAQVLLGADAHRVPPDSLPQSALRKIFEAQSEIGARQFQHLLFEEMGTLAATWREEGFRLRKARDRSSNPHSVVGRIDTVLGLHSALGKLPRLHQRLLRAYCLEGLTTARIADDIGKSSNTTRRLLTVALTRWREEFGEDPMSYL